MTREKKVFLAHTKRMLYFFFYIHNRRRLDRYDFERAGARLSSLQIYLGVGSPFPRCFSALGCGDV